jgi:hypothetical protein
MTFSKKKKKKTQQIMGHQNARMAIRKSNRANKTLIIYNIVDE